MASLLQEGLTTIDSPIHYEQALGTINNSFHKGTKTDFNLLFNSVERCFTMLHQTKILNRSQEVLHIYGKLFI